MKLTSYSILCIIVLFSLLSCRAEKSKENIDTQSWSDDHSVDFNQEVNEREQIQIRLFLEHYKSLKMTLTESGLRYMIYKNGDGEVLAKTGQFVNVRMKMELLDGTICYETPAAETDKFVLEKSENESGIHEALRLMKKGDHSKLILPSYLGHGLLGDRDKIPPQSILYVDLELVDIK
jgi:FKBP-type peptidyl-prolyl cis-trans isomerase